MEQLFIINSQLQFGGASSQNCAGNANASRLQAQEQYENSLIEELQALMLKVKSILGANSQEYHQFKNICKESHGIDDIVQCFKNIEDCLRPNNELIGDLNKLLPQRYQIEDPVDMNNAVDFIHQIKDKAADIYQRFIDTLKKHDNKEINLFQMNDIVQGLMKPYPHLLDQFKRFLPEFTNENAGLENSSSRAPPSQQRFQGSKSRKEIKKQDSEKPLAPQQEQNKKSFVQKNGGQSLQIGSGTAAGGGGGGARSRQSVKENSQVQNDNLINQNAAQAASLLGSQQYKSLPKTEYAFFEKLRISLKDDQSYDEIMKCFYCYVEGVFNQFEFFEIIDPYFDKNNEEILTTLKGIVALRDTSRRNHNLLCKPFSEFDTSHFKKISYSYYEMPADFPRPISSGRSRPEIKELCKVVYNDDYSSLPTGSESFKFKTKNQYEDVLFKLEDEMYKADFEIGNFLKTMTILEEEKNKIDKMNQEEKDQYKIDPRQFNTLRLKWIEKTYAEINLGQQILQLLPQNPIKAIPIIYDRFKTNHQRAVEEKNEQIKAWHESCEKNFSKSLDHRSFHFKFFEKKSSQPKAYLNEIKSLATASLKNKNINELKGGSKNAPFYGSYAAFEPICVHSYEAMNTADIKSDHPINLQDPELLNNVEILPQMRFLFNDQKIFDLTVQLVLAGIKTVNYNSGEKEKIRLTLRNILEQFLSVQNFVELREVSSALVYLSDEQIEIICGQEYYEAKSKDLIQYTRTHISPSELEEKILEQKEAAATVVQEEDNDSDEKEDSDDDNNNNSNDESSKKHEDQQNPEANNNQKQPTNKATTLPEQHQPISIQSYEGDATIISNPIFMPYYKPGYKLMITSQHHYILLRQIYTIYERLIKAKDLVGQKVDEDLMLKQSDAYNQQRDEYKQDRFDIFVGGVLSAMSPTLDTGKYEDFARQLLGSRAYLLFQFDKLIIATVKQILSVSNEEATQKSFKMFQKFQEQIAKRQENGLSNEFWNNESMYLSHFSTKMSAINNFSGVGIRLLYSPASKILTLHYFSTNSYNLTDNKKLYNEMNNYVENQTLDEVNHLENYSSLFLKRQIKMIEKVRKIDDMYMKNQIIPRIQPQVYRLQFESQQEDVLLVKRKTKLKLEEEFMFDIKTQHRFDQLKRAKFEEMTENGASTAGTTNSRTADNNLQANGNGNGNGNHGNVATTTISDNVATTIKAEEVEDV